MPRIFRKKGGTKVCVVCTSEVTWYRLFKALCCRRAVAVFYVTERFRVLYYTNNRRVTAVLTLDSPHRTEILYNAVPVHFLPTSTPPMYCLFTPTP